MGKMGKMERMDKMGKTDRMEQTAPMATALLTTVRPAGRRAAR